MVHIQLYTSRIACPFRIRIVDFWPGHGINDVAEAYKGIREREHRAPYAGKEKLVSISVSETQVLKTCTKSSATA